SPAIDLCRLLEVDLVMITAARHCGPEAESTTGQAFVVALDTVLQAGETGARLTLNRVVDALADCWSLSFVDARTASGAQTLYDMTERTVKATWRELLLAGVNVPAIWDLLIRQTRKPRKPPHLPPHPQLARVYAVTMAEGQGHARGRKVWLADNPLPDGVGDPRLLDDVRTRILADPCYRRREHWRLLLADEPASPLPTRQDVCAGVGYNVVRLGARSQRVLDQLERARIEFNVHQFRVDFEAVES